MLYVDLQVFIWNTSNLFVNYGIVEDEKNKMYPLLFVQYEMVLQKMKNWFYWFKD